ncbi:hypothetical protein [Oceanobacillus alkalisoli]|uniref:hypothetical protein n=1 Tax=Oceanobacillus alkalisoli TaxID=2925113 RepID=UPI001EE45C73|nr:hypothetical protein [Oceanobacillus alkalisoli]MCG5104436.1 hypothetical protein [Oceanobacillus alkalisoli]
MSEETNGRNILDVAMELTKIHLRSWGVSDSDELKKVYTEYYSLVKAVGNKQGRNLYDFLPEEIISKFKGE